MYIFVLDIAPSSKLRNKWVLGQDYYRLDGKTAKNLRHEMVKRFNDPENRQSRVFLISAKAGGQGINLIGANRVIILDTSWNPSNDQQNIFRIFRLGQKRICYIYRLLAMGTMEEKVYSRSVTKQAMSFRVVDEQQIDRHYSMAELAELYTLTKPIMSERPMPIFPQDSILASLLLNFPEMVYKYHEHDSLLENKMEQELSEQEKADAWAAYERDLQITSEMQEPNTEGLKNPYGMPPYFRNPYAPLGGIDMQTILNYGNLASSASTAPYIQSMLSQYSNFPGTSHQQYMDVLNMYSKYAQSSLGFPDLNALGAGSPFAGTSGPPSLTGKPSMPGAATSPLSALGDLTGFYGMPGLGKSYGAPNTGAGSTNPTSGMFMQRSPATTESMMFPSTFNGKSTSSYPTAYPHSGMYNFGSDFAPTAASANLMNLSYPSNSASNMHLSNSPAPAPPNTISLTTSGLFPTPMTTTAPSMSTINNSNKSKNAAAAANTTNSNMSKNNAPPITSRIDLTKMPMEYSSTNPPPLVDLTKLPTQTSPTVTKRNMQKNETSQSKTSTVSATSTISSPSMRTHVVSALNKQAAALSPVGKNNKNLTSKLNSEMLIIPTTSPPGPTSISKQFSDISPSISLTALNNNTPTLTPINTHNAQNSKSLNNTNKTQMPSPTFLPLSNGKAATTKSITTTTSTIPNTAKTLTNQQAIPPLNKTQPKIQVAKFAALSRQTNNASPVNNNNSNNVRKLAGTPAKLVSSRAAAPAAAATTMKNLNIITTPAATAAITNKRAVYPPLANLSFTNQKKPNATTTALTPAQLQRLRAFGVNASAGSAAPKVASNEISIRPMDTKANSATGDNVYIIETNINDKRVAIGAPTRSGNGTTVTKVTTPAKRKHVDVLQMDRKKQR